MTTWIVSASTPNGLAGEGAARLEADTREEARAAYQARHPSWIIHRVRKAPERRKASA